VATLTDDELARIRAEVGDHVLATDAEPYFGSQHVYSVIRDNVTSSATAATTSSTTVSAAGPTTISVASATGLVAGYKIQLDCDGQRETCTIRNVSGTTLSIICKKAHSGTYPVEIESPLTIVRGILYDLASLEQNEAIGAVGSAGLKQVDEVVFKDGEDVSIAVERVRQTLRKKLAQLTGLNHLLRLSSGGDSYEVY